MIAPDRPPAPRLVLVEGSIGTGKSTTARLLAAALTDRGVPARVVQEGDPEHPADFESVALLPQGRLESLVAGHPTWAARLRGATEEDPDGVLVPYGLLERDHGPLPPDLLAQLRAHDVYELPLEQHLRLRRARWDRFVATAQAGDEVWVLESCFLQNAVTVTLLRDDAEEAVLTRFVGEMARSAAVLSPVVVRLRADDVGAAFRAAAGERPQWWLEHVVTYYTDRGLGRRLGMRGIEGTVAALEERARVEERVLAACRLPVVAVAAVRDREEALPGDLARLVERVARDRPQPA